MTRKYPESAKCMCTHPRDHHDLGRDGACLRCECACYRAAAVAEEEPAVPGLRLVSIESPFSGNIEANIAYARACMRDSIARGEAPIASHLLYTQDGILDDADPDEREQGMRCGFAWNRYAEATVVYTDLGTSQGMERGIEEARKAGRAIEYRSLHPYKVRR